MGVDDRASIKVAGLAELRKELKKLDESGLIDQLKDANFEVGQIVVRHAQTKAAALGKMEARAAESLKASRAASRAQITGGGPKTPFFGGAEFGSDRSKVRNTMRGLMLGWNQFKPWTGSDSSAGRFLYPTIRSDAGEIVDIYGDAIAKITGQAFPDN